MPCDYDLGQAGQGLLGSLTNFWPCQLWPVQAMQTIYVFCFSFSILAPAIPRPGQARLALWPWLPQVFLSPGQHGQSLATNRAHPGFQAGL